MARDGSGAPQFAIAIGEYVLQCIPDGLPAAFDSYARHAILVERFEVDQRNLCCVVVGRANEPWPFLVVAQSFSPAGAGFEPGVLLAPDTGRLFVGAGERLLAYDLAVPSRLWVDRADTGFWRWARHDDVVLMSAELEFAAWTPKGEKLWTTFVEPPWEYMVEGETVMLDVMGSRRRFPILEGPPLPAK